MNVDVGNAGDVGDALEAAFPDRPVEDLVVDLGPSWNGGNDTVRVDFADGDSVYLKVAIAGDGSRIARERAVLAYVAGTGSVPVPSVLAADADADVPYLATGPAPGRELLPAFEAAGRSRRRSLLWRVGAALAAVHERRFETHGEILGDGRHGGALDTADGRSAGERSADGRSAGERSADGRSAGDVTGGGAGLELETADWTDVLCATIERTREIGTTDRLEGHFAAVRDCVEANRDVLDGAPAALLHGDVAKPNAFVVDRDRGSDGERDRGSDGERGRGPDADIENDAGSPGIALIDWELAHVGDPARDLVRARDQLCNGFDTDGPSRLGEAVYAGYRARAGGLPEGFAARRPIYRVVRVLGRSGFIDQWATYLDEPVEDLVDRIDAELDSRLDAVGSGGP
jgi:aminoglycoside phosphotransferase (APT) family kinase protein